MKKRSRFAVCNEETGPEQKGVEQTQTKPKPPNYERARKQSIAEKKQKKKKHCRKLQERKKQSCRKRGKKRKRRLTSS